MKKNNGENEKRLTSIRKEMAALGPVLLGDMSAKKQKYRKTDGTISLQKAPSIFRFAKTGGKMTKRIPASAESAVRKMIVAGKEYGVLRNEYERILTVLSLEGTLKKSTDGPTSAHGESSGRHQRSDH